MTPSAVSRRAVVDRLALVDQLVADIRSLPLGDRPAFFADRRNLWSAESCLRRALEALLDAGRHILSKGFGRGVTEYKEIAVGLGETGVLPEADAATLRVLAGYRNRLVHFYHEVTPDELFAICGAQLGDLERVRAALGAWLLSHAERTRA